MLQFFSLLKAQIEIKKRTVLITQTSTVQGKINWKYNTTELVRVKTQL